MSDMIDNSEFERCINASDLIDWIIETCPDWCEGAIRTIVDHIDEMPSAQPEPCKDAVSRQRLLSDLKELVTAWKKYPVMAEEIKGVEAAIGYVELIPSVKPNLKELSETHNALDTISRQAAIDAFTDEIQVTGRANAESVKAYVKLVVDRIKRLPSAQPEKRTEERAETHACDLIERQAMNDDKMKIGDEVAFHWNDGRPDTVVVITHIGYDGFIDGMDAKGTLYASKNPQKWTKTGRYFPLVTHLLRQMSGDKLPSA